MQVRSDPEMVRAAVARSILWLGMSHVRAESCYASRARLPFASDQRPHTMPKRKAPTKISGLVGSDDDDLMGLSSSEAPPPASQESRDEPPAKKRRGRPRTSHENEPESKPTAQAKTSEPATSQPEPKKPGRRGRPRGSSRTSNGDARASVTREPLDDQPNEQENEDPEGSKETKTTRATRGGRPAAGRGRGRGRAASAARQLDGEFEYTPTSFRQASAGQGNLQGDTEPSPRPRGAQRRKNEPEVAESQHVDEPAPEVDETILPDDQPQSHQATSSGAKGARVRFSALRNNQDSSPRKRKSGVESDQGGDPELRRKIGDLTKKNEALESKYRNLREIGIVEANSNMDKLRKQCESITTGMYSPWTRLLNVRLISFQLQMNWLPRFDRN